jgi:omega-amidase
MIMKIAAVQMLVTDDKQQNLEAAAVAVTQLASQGADLVVLPEMFCCPYQTDLFSVYAEPAEGPSYWFLSELAARLRIWLVAGSMPESDSEGHVLNTSYVFNREGQLAARHSKAHLFDINVTGGQYFRESDTLTAGSHATTFATEFGAVGLCICYDFRFPELTRKMVLDGAQLIVVPGAFNQTTGPAHWELLFRSRAVDNQVYTLGCAPASNLAASYQSWGHSILAGPWGNVICQLDEQPGQILETLDFSVVERVRRDLPLLLHRRPELY